MKQVRREIARVKESVTGAERRSPTTWLELEKESFTGTVKTLPLREEVGLEIKEQLIVEFYSR